MIIFPAIDIKDGKCVRLKEGDFAQKTVYSDNPAEMALRWQKEGCEFLHIVDLDGALEGKSKNLQVIKDILALSKVPVQVGGGIRNMETVDEMLTLGVARVILGSAAVKNPEFVKAATSKYDDRIVIGIDAKNGEAAISGWGEKSGINAADLALNMKKQGVKRIIYTDISRDGTLTGVNAQETAELAEKTGLKIIASGGVASIDDIKILKSYLNIEGVIVGKAIYDGRVDLKQAIDLAKEG